MDLEIWKESILVNDQMFDVADNLEERRMYKVAEQLRAASLSISNNIAEGSGSTSSKDFAHFLNIAHRSVFEVVNILIVINKRRFVDDSQLNSFLKLLEPLSKKISNFRKTLIKNSD